jgi:transposase
MPMLTGRVDFVIGVDTHKYRHAAAVVDAVGGVLADVEVETDRAGLKILLDWADARARGRRVWALEGTGSYGTGLTRELLHKGETVYEIDRPKRAQRRGGAKSDRIDAVRAAREALSRDKLALPRSGSGREAVRVLLVAREMAVKSYRDYLILLKAELVQLPPAQRERLQGLSTMALLRGCLKLRARTHGEAWEVLAASRLRRLAQRVLRFKRDAAEDELQLRTLMQELAPKLVAEFGVSTLHAAEFFNAWAHAGRIPSDAAFAALAGVAPIPASSGEQIRFRLNRGGDRRLNRSLHQMVLCRIGHHPPTQVYVARRLKEGKTRAEIRRCLKRYAARRVFRLLQASEQGEPILPLDKT